MKKSISFIVIALSLCCLLSGCKDFKDVDRRAFVVAIGIDVNPDNKREMQVVYKVAAANLQSSSGGDSVGGGESEIYTVEGESLADIFRVIKTKTFEEPDFAHMKLILFGSEFIKNNSIDPVIQFFVRRRDFQNIAYTAVGYPSAKALLSHKLKEENFAGNGLFLKFGEGAENPYGLHRRIYELYRQIVTPGISPSLPIIELKENKFVMEKICILSRGKTKLELGRDESKIFNMLTRRIPLASLSMKEGNEEVGIGLRDVSGKIKYDGKSKNLNFNVNIKAKALLEEVGTTYITKEDLEKRFSELLTKRTESLFIKLKENNLDPFELEIKYWSSNRDFNFNEEWLESEIPRAKFNVNCKINVVSTGSLK
jgi:spore germination protein KC